jgi:hypothetical protein
VCGIVAEDDRGKLSNLHWQHEQEVAVDSYAVSATVTATQRELR